jgi:hypothetical protein
MADAGAVAVRKRTQREADLRTQVLRATRQHGIRHPCRRQLSSPAALLRNRQASVGCVAASGGGSIALVKLHELDVHVGTRIGQRRFLLGVR